MSEDYQYDEVGEFVVCKACGRTDYLHELACPGGSEKMAKPLPSLPADRFRGFCD